MNRKRTIVLGASIIGLVFALSAGTYAYKHVPKKTKPASHPTATARSVSPSAQKSSIVLSGKVTDEHEAPLSGVLISIGGIAAASDKLGNYQLVLDNRFAGQAQVRFYGATGRDSYAPTNLKSATIKLSPGQEVHQDFSLKKLPSVEN